MFNALKIWVISPFYLVWKAPGVRKANKIEDEKERTIALQNFFHDYIKFIFNIMNIEVKTTGLDNIPADESALFVANHQSILDPLIIITGTQNYFSFMIAAEYQFTERIPVLGTVLKSMHNVFIDRSKLKESIRALNQGIENLKEGRNFMIFPEGEITHLITDEKIGEFKSGSFKTALKAKTGIVPMTILGSEKIQKRVSIFGSIHSGAVELIIHPFIRYDDIKGMDSKDVAEMVQNIVKKEL